MIEDDPEDEPTEKELAVEAAIDQALIASSDAARRVIEECHDAFGYGIPTVVLGQVGQWFWQAARVPASDEGRDALRAAQVLSELYVAGDDFTQTAIVTGFLEALPFPHEEGRDVVEFLPGPLREQRRRMED